MYSDASGKIGFGAVCGSECMSQSWPKEFLVKHKPSIEYLELFAVTAAVLAWIDKFRNQRVILFCDNQSVVSMINLTTTSCKNYMVLIRAIVLKGLIENVRVFARHVRGVNNGLADDLSRDKLVHFYKLCEEENRKVASYPTPVPDAIWPIETIWKN